MPAKLFVDKPEFLVAIKNEINTLKERCEYIDTEICEDNGFDRMIYKYNNFMYNIGVHNDYAGNMDCDIELIWFIHLLHPKRYRKDCYKHFGRIITPQNIRKNGETNMNLNVNDGDFRMTDLDLKQSLLNQYKFMKKILNNDNILNVNDDEIKKWINEYKNFMYIIGESNDIVVPSIYVDLIWHVHMYYHKEYFNDSVILSHGIFVNHHDLLEKSVLEKQRKYTHDILNGNKSSFLGNKYMVLSLLVIIAVLLSIMYILKALWNREYGRRSLTETSNADVFKMMIGGTLLVYGFGFISSNRKFHRRISIIHRHFMRYRIRFNNYNTAVHTTQPASVFQNTRINRIANMRHKIKRVYEGVYTSVTTDKSINECKNALHITSYCMDENEFDNFRDNLNKLYKTNQYNSSVTDEVYNTILIYNVILDDVKYKRKYSDWDVEYERMRQLLRKRDFNMKFKLTVLDTIKHDMDILFDDIYPIIKDNKMKNIDEIITVFLKINPTKYKILTRNKSIIKEALFCRKYLKKNNEEYWLKGDPDSSDGFVYYMAEWGACGGSKNDG